MNFKEIIFLFIFILSKCCADLKVETLPNQRVTQYSISPYEKVVIFSAPRTGSSLLYNVFRFLFEKEENFCHLHNSFNSDCLILKEHRELKIEEIKDENVLYIVPTRNPIDACISHYRIAPLDKQKNKFFPAIILKIQAKALLYSEKLLREGKKVTHLKYEDFADDFDYLFKFVEEKLNISICDSDKETIRNGYARENVHKSIEELADFSSYLPISGFHGAHVTLEEYIPPLSLLNQLNEHLEKFKPIFQRYGYFLE